MAANRFWYSISLILFFFLSVMYFEPFPVFCLLLLGIVPVVCFLIELPLLWMTSVQLVCADSVCEAGEKNNITITVKNPAWIPVSRLCLWLQIENKMSGQKTEYPILVSVPARNEIPVSLSLRSDHCGSVSLSLKWIQLIGTIPVYSWKRNVKRTESDEKNTAAEIVVAPHIQELSVEISQGTRNFSVDWDSYEALRPGDNVAQIYQIREFQPGDRLQHVHWKLSARMEGWMVKEFSRHEGASVIIAVDWGEESFESLDRMMEAAASLSLAMVMKSCKNLLISSVSPEGEWFAVEQEEDLYTVLGRQMRQGNAADKKTVPKRMMLLEELEKKCGGMTFAHLYYVTDRKEESFAVLLGTSRIAAKKTLVYTGEKQEQMLAAAMERWKVEFVCTGEHSRRILREWDWIV